MKWWQNKTAYQIYPKSFLDTDGDGIGNLNGITEKLDYLKSLHVDLIWISPCYCSPMADEGYDISDYYRIDPRFGTMEDFDRLLSEAKKREIGIIMDLVVNHCSDEHEWFQKACEDPDGKYGKYFYIEAFDGEHYPNNLRSIFGGRAWTLLPGHTDKVYLHHFHQKQPDLNWENEEVREEVYKMVNWWLDKGLAGFRIDAINHIKKDLPWRDYEADRPDGLSSVSTMLKHAKGLDVRLHELRDRCFVPHDAFTVGEVFGMTKAKLEENIGKDGYFCSVFDFKATHYGRNYTDAAKSLRVVSGEDFKKCYFLAQEEASDTGIMSLVLENHDLPRAATHFLEEDLRNDMGKKMLGGLYFFGKGIPFIYQGQEIGMENREYTSRDQLVDVSARNIFDTVVENGYSKEEACAVISAISRDHTRTPMQWSDAAEAGFTDGTPWQPVNPLYTKIHVRGQEADPHSVLSFYRSMSALRNSETYNRLFADGVFEPYLADENNLVAYWRKDEKQAVLVLGNWQKEERVVELPEGTYRVLLSNGKEPFITTDGIHLDGLQFVVLAQK